MTVYRDIVRCDLCQKTFKTIAEINEHLCPTQMRANHQALPPHKHSDTLNALDRIRSYIDFEIARLQEDRS